MNTGIIVQARMASTRLPGKVLLPLPRQSQQTVLDQVLQRLAGFSKARHLIVATTIGPEDDVLAARCQEAGYTVFRGSAYNVLERYCLAARAYDLDVIVRVTSDCPCVDSDVLERLYRLFCQNALDYASSARTQTFPHGSDLEIMSRKALEIAYTHAETAYETEHVTPYIYHSHPEAFAIGGLQAEPEETDPTLRITLDTPHDYTMLSALFDLMPPQASTREIVATVKRYPWLRELNQLSRSKRYTATLTEELDEAMVLLQLHELPQAAAALLTLQMQRDAGGGES